jgi:hypothetical protein
VWNGERIVNPKQLCSFYLSGNDDWQLKQMYHIDYLFVSQTTSAGAQVRLQRPFAVKRNCRPAASTAIATASTSSKRAQSRRRFSHKTHTASLNFI